MKLFIQFTLSVALFGLAHFQSQAAFTSFHVFGDSISCTASNTAAGSLYYGKRYSNGRVWVEVLAQQQGLAFNPTNNTNSYFGNYSTNLLKTLNSYIAPQDSSTSLAVVWVNNADLFDPALNPSTTLSQWTNIINQSQTNHFRIITNLYLKGFRTLIMPNVVDLSTVPNFNTTSGGYTNTVHQQCVAYNNAFSATINRVRTSANYPGLIIYTPDFYTLLTDLLVHPANYGVTNALKNGLSIDAVTALINPSLTNGPGTNYIFWDPTDPTAKVHNWMASLAQQLISPVQIGGITAFDGSNRLDIVNVPVGQNGIVVGSGDLSSGNWATNLAFSSTNIAQSVWVTNTGPQGFYKLSFPVIWTWP